MLLDCLVLLRQSCYSSGCERGLKAVCVCVCVQQGEVAAHFNSQFRLCLGVALITPKIKGDCVYNLLLACFLLMMVPGPAISSYGIWTVLCKRHKAGNTQELLFSPKPFELLENWLKKALTGDMARNYLHLTPGALMDSGISETCKPVFSLPNYHYLMLRCFWQ